MKTENKQTNGHNYTAILHDQLRYTIFVFCVNSYLLLGFFEHSYGTSNSKASFIFGIMLSNLALQLGLLLLFQKNYYVLTNVGAVNISLLLFTLSIITGFDEVLNRLLEHESLISLGNPTYSYILIAGTFIGYAFVNNKKLLETRNVSAKVMVDFLEEKYSPITKRNFALINLLVILISVSPFILYINQNSKEIVPIWIIYIHSTVIGIWQGIWIFLLLNEDEFSSRFKKNLLLIDRTGTVLTITFSIIVLLYYLGVIQNMSIFFLKSIPAISNTLSNLMSWLINTILSGIIGNWAYEKIKIIKINTAKQNRNQKARKKNKKNEKS